MGKQCGSSGAGLGFRDMVFEDLSGTELQRAKKNLKQLQSKVKGLAFEEN